LKLSHTQFKNFVDVCSVIEFVSNDIHIYNGNIKQFARRRSFIIHVDMSSIFGEIEDMIESIKLSAAKERLKVFNAFLTNDSSDFYLEYDGNYYILRDNVSSFFIREPDVDALENRYDDTATPGELLEEHVIFEYKLDSNLLKKLKTISEVCNSNTLDVKLFHNTGKANLVLTGSAKVLASTLVSFDYNVDVLEKINIEGKVSFDCMLFSDNVTIKMYKLDDNFVAFYTEMEIGGCPVKFYQRIRYGEIINDEEINHV